MPAKSLDLPQRGDLETIVRRHLGAAPEHRQAIERLIEEFLKRRDDQLKVIATDQLLNAVFMVVHGIDPTMRETLQDALLRALSEGG